MKGLMCNILGGGVIFSSSSRAYQEGEDEATVQAAQEIEIHK
jgi:hypothetical protein